MASLKRQGDVAFWTKPSRRWMSAVGTSRHKGFAVSRATGWEAHDRQL